MAVFPAGTSHFEWARLTCSRDQTRLVSDGDSASRMLRAAELVTLKYAY